MTTTVAALTWPQALGWRLGRHRLDPLGDESVADVVRRLVAVPAQDESRAELAVRTRQGSSEPGSLRRALEAGTVMKTFAFRGSMHYLHPQDAGAYLALRAAGRQWERRSWVEHYRLTAQDWPDFRATVRDGLADGPRVLPELVEVVTAVPAYRHLAPLMETDPWTLLKALSWQGDLCFAPSRDGLPTFQRPDHLPAWAGVPDLEESGPRAIAAYLRAYGPVTPAQVHYWLGEGMSAGRRRVERWWSELGDELAALDVDGTTAYLLRDDVDDALVASESTAVRLLPGHDQWVMGPGTKDEHVVPPELREAVTRKADLVVVGGVVRGTWTCRKDGLSLSWHGRPPTPGAGLVEERERLGHLLGRELTLT